MCTIIVPIVENTHWLTAVIIMFQGQHGAYNSFRRIVDRRPIIQINQQSWHHL
jgi:hypothetical protein